MACSAGQPRGPENVYTAISVVVGVVVVVVGGSSSSSIRIIGPQRLLLVVAVLACRVYAGSTQKVVYFVFFFVSLKNLVGAKLYFFSINSKATLSRCPLARLR